jgi:deoxyribose-phosphate aldolase
MIQKYIDHTLLKPEAQGKDIEKLCMEAANYGFFSVCVNPFYVKLASSLLTNTPVKVAGVVGFPLGSNKIYIKAKESEALVKDGASELDMVINIGALKDKDYDLVARDIKEVLNSAGKGILLKVILETGLLTHDEKIDACKVVAQTGAHFVKTSTGFLGKGATFEDIKLMRAVVGPSFGVKASGGIGDYPTAKAMIDAGATRIGASRSIAIVEGLAMAKDKDGY